MASLIIPRHTVPSLPSGLSPLQHSLIHDPAPIRICSAPTGAGKTYAFVRAALDGANVLFMVPTRRLAQNIHDTIIQDFQKLGGMSSERARHHVALWTSDSRARDVAQGLSGQDIRHKRLQEMQQSGQALPETGSFLIATPESIAHYLAGDRSHYGFSAEDKASLTDLLQRDHIVCDEFHTIDVRGYGIAVAIAAVVHKQTEQSGQRARLSFLSATPVDITPVLNACDIPDSAVAHLAETIHSYPADPAVLAHDSAVHTALTIAPPPSLPDARWVHGDVRLELDTTAPSMADLVEENREAIRACLSSPDEQVIVIYDKLGTMNAERDRILNIFQSHGLTHRDIHRISSIDDSIGEAEEKHGISGHTLDPKKSKVIIATASVEMGVTLNSRLMFIEPGHSPASFVQRIGRVARTNKNGVVIIRGHANAWNGKQWFQSVRALFDTKPTDHNSLPALPIDTAVRSMLAWLSNSLAVNNTRDFDAPIPTFDKIPVRAAWCAGLFWSSMCSRHKLHAGHKATYAQHAFPKARSIYSMLRKMQAIDPRPNSPQQRWVQAFLREALTLRAIAPRVYVADAVGLRSIPWHHFARNEYLLKLPRLISMEGNVHVDCPIGLAEALSKPKADKPVPLVYDILVPHRITTHPAESGRELEAWKRAIRAEERDSRNGPNDLAALDIANTLVLCTGIVPKSQSDGAGLQGPGSGVA